MSLSDSSSESLKLKLPLPGNQFAQYSRYSWKNFTKIINNYLKDVGAVLEEAQHVDAAVRTELSDLETPVPGEAVNPEDDWPLSLRPGQVRVQVLENLEGDLAVGEAALAHGELPLIRDLALGQVRQMSAAFSTHHILE